MVGPTLLPGGCPLMHITSIYRTSLQVIKPRVRPLIRSLIVQGSLSYLDDQFTQHGD